MTAPWVLIRVAWLVTIVVWIVMGRGGGKPTLRSQSAVPQLIHLGAIFATALLMAVGPHTALYVPSDAAVWIGAIITCLGAALAIVARLQLGKNWSPHVSVKSGHELMQTGAYAISRHPIYTGLLFALAGTAGALGEFRGFAAFAVLAVSLHRKASAEEAFLKNQFGAQYESYTKRVKRLVPFVW